MPHGRTLDQCTLAEMNIGNVGRGEGLNEANYEFKAFEAPSMYSNGVEAHHSIENYDRAQPSLRLVYEALRKVFENDVR